MVQARLSLMQALDTATAQCNDRQLEQILACVRRDVQRGGSLADSLGKHPRVFSRLYVHLTHVGEVAGILDRVLLRLAVYLEKAAALKRKVRLALFYPGLILAVALVAIVFFLTTIAPTFAEMYADFGQDLPVPTRIILQVSKAMTGFFPVLAAAIGLLASGIVWVLRTPRGRLRWERLKVRAPLLGALLLHNLTARFCRTLGTLLASGVTLTEALALLTQAAGNRYVEEELKGVLARVRRGSSLHQPLARAGFFPGMVVQLIAVGEQTADLDAMLLHAAEHFEKEVEVSLEALTALIEPVLIVVIGLLLGGILVSLYLPMFELVNVAG